MIQRNNSPSGKMSKVDGKNGEYKRGNKKSAVAKLHHLDGIELSRVYVQRRVGAYIALNRLLLLLEFFF